MNVHFQIKCLSNPERCKQCGVIKFKGNGKICLNFLSGSGSVYVYDNIKTIREITYITFSSSLGSEMK